MTTASDNGDLIEDEIPRPGDPGSVILYSERVEDDADPPPAPPSQPPPPAPPSQPISYNAGDDDAGDIEEHVSPVSFQSEKPVLHALQKTKTLHEQRFSLARSLLFIVAGLAAGFLIFAVFAPADRLDPIQSLAPVIFGPIVTLLGTILGWYFASNRTSESKE